MNISCVVSSQELLNQSPRARSFSHLRCGVWSFINNELVFVPHFVDSRRGRVLFGHRQLALLYEDRNSLESKSAYRVNIKYFDVDTATTGDYKRPTVTFTLHVPPAFYSKPSIDLTTVFANLSFLGVNGLKLPPLKNKKRITSINQAHSDVVGTCFVYQIQLADYRQLSEVYQFLKHNRHLASAAINHPTPIVNPSISLASSFRRLDTALADLESYNTLPFDVKFQLLRLARNGALLPDQVVAILPTITLLIANHDGPTIVESLRRLYQSLQPIGPHSEAEDYSVNTIANNLLDYAQKYDNSRSQNPYELINRHSHIVLVHKLTVTVAGVYLEGPEPEVSNRVLRKYQDHSDYFIRVTFADEDGEPVRYEGQSDQKEVYARFRKFMDSVYFIGGRGFSFLGFSHSSLRSQTCWFMAPFEFEGEILHAPALIKSLGHFGSIRTPARCAARIGQAFTDTTGTVGVEAEMQVTLRDVERNGRCFSDGCGTISLGLLEKVWPVYGSRRTLKPVILQIRQAGTKGVVSLDSRLVGDQFCIRPSMVKFEGSTSVTLEVCGAAWRPYPMVLNRQFIKILEDLEVPLESFATLQDEAVEKLRLMTTNTFNASLLLNDTQTSKAARLPSFLEMLADIGLEYHDDSFLRGVVEMAVITKLREIKYKGRIPVKNGVTLYGIMDETGHLKEGQIYVVTQSSPDEPRKVITKDKVIITRSPALHPGDIRIVEAVDVPEDSPLKYLRNCVVFSQHGNRDLPSQLSGGDLDGDLYNVIFEPTLMPQRDIAPPADYPRVPGLELDREVTIQDMSSFFVEFMETDQLGQICTRHLQIADQEPMGVFDAACIELASMASTAVDFSKTGIAVSMDRAPRAQPAKPDFMAPSPRVIIEAGGYASFEDAVQNEEEEETDPIGDLDDIRPVRYYRSEKALGHLYRSIDEQEFLRTLQDATQNLPGQDGTVLSTLWAYVQQYTGVIQWKHHIELARQIRDGYEQTLLQSLYQFASSPRHPLTETEIFSGTILGRDGGKQSRRVRETTQAMREQLEEVLTFTISRIIDGDYDDNDRNEEALPRAIACLAVGMDEQPMGDKKVGELQSWKYIAAGVCLREIKRCQTALSKDPLRHRPSRRASHLSFGIVWRATIGQPAMPERNPKVHDSFPVFDTVDRDVVIAINELDVCLVKHFGSRWMHVGSDLYHDLVRQSSERAQAVVKLGQIDLDILASDGNVKRVPMSMCRSRIIAQVGCQDFSAHATASACKGEQVVNIGVVNGTIEHFGPSLNGSILQIRSLAGCHLYLQGALDNALAARETIFKQIGEDYCAGREKSGIIAKNDGWSGELFVKEGSWHAAQSQMLFPRSHCAWRLATLITLSQLLSAHSLSHQLNHCNFSPVVTRHRHDTSVPVHFLEPYTKVLVSMIQKPDTKALLTLSNPITGPRTFGLEKLLIQCDDLHGAKLFEKHSKLYSRGHERTQSFGDLERVFDSDLLLCVDFRQLSVQAR
ncbi:RNA-directed RNA polymerase, partial [Aureobasidium melanogenum]